MAANDLVPADNLAYLLRFDTVYGRYDREVHAEEDALAFSDKGMTMLNHKRIRMLNEKDPSRFPWGDLGVELVFECIGVFREEEDLQKHLDAGAKMMVLSATPKSEGVPMVVPGATPVGDGVLSSPLVSTASCTTNCVAPVMEILDRRIGVEKSLMSSTHAYTASQELVDGPSKKIRRGRAAASNLVPTSTGAAEATTDAVPGLTREFDGVAIRAPLAVGSIADIVVLTSRDTSADEVNGILKEEAGTDRYRDILGASDDSLVSSDIVRDSRGSIVDLEMTRVVGGNLVKVMSWYDNEWGYACRMVRHAVARSWAPAAAR